MEALHDYIKQYIEECNVRGELISDNAGEILALKLAEKLDHDGVGGEQVQNDWNQNDYTKPDYVKNRPFYTGE